MKMCCGFLVLVLKVELRTAMHGCLNFLTLPSDYGSLERLQAIETSVTFEDSVNECEQVLYCRHTSSPCPLTVPANRSLKAAEFTFLVIIKQLHRSEGM